MKKVIIPILILCNLFLVIGIYYYETRTHQIQILLHNRGLITIEEVIRPDKYWNQDWTSCLKKLRINADVALFGDSITAGSDFQSYFPDLTIVELGLSGNRLYDMKRRVNAISAVCPKKVFIMAGINDINHLSIEELTLRYRDLLLSIMEVSPSSKIYVQSILPICENQISNYADNKTISTANNSLLSLCYEMDITFIDLYSTFISNGKLPNEYSNDGIHINELGYSLWAEQIRNYVY